MDEAPAACRRAGGTDDREPVTNVRRRARWFGRARHLTARKKVAEVVYELAYRWGWPARLARPLGLTGELDVAVHELSIRSTAELSPLRVAFISDLHAGPATHPALIDAACRAVAAWTPDLLLLGGDFVSFHARHAKRLVAPLSAIEAPLGKIAVLGNHDLIGDEEFIVSQLADAGVRVLVNENVRLAAPFAPVFVCGLDNTEEGVPDGARAMAGTEAADGEPTERLVLMHSPDGLQALEGRDFAMAFCGHTHGGQFVLDSGKALVNFHGPLSREYLRGGVFTLGADGRRILLVSRGIGCGSLPMRRGADPQVHLCTLTFERRAV